MAKKLFIGKYIDQKGVFSLLEDSGDGILRESFGKLQGGDSLKTICTELNKFFLKVQTGTSTNETAFIVSNLSSEMMIVESDSGMMFLGPLDPSEMRHFHDTFRAAGKYI
ncbi:MAG: hypothetical protein ACOYMB_01935 [Patescibacteria group bacterium]